MFYKTSYCFTSKELFDNFNVKQIKIDKNTVSKKYKCESKQALCAKVLNYCFYLIILDIIENNSTFVLPLKNREAMIHVKQFTGDTFKNMYRKGKFKGIDFLNSNFKGYQLYFYYQYKGGYRDKPIYINTTLKEIFYENINNGKQYY